MTVCVAALCDGFTILGASDRMLTAGDVQFEPQQSKLWAMTSSIVAMVAGDSAFQTEILQDVEAIVRKRIEAYPDEWLTVRFVASVYVDVYNRARLRRAEISVLAPLGLDHNSFIGRQHEISPELARQLAAGLLNFEPPSVACIFAGVDTTGGGHLYVTSNADLRCHDSVGFASVGAGRWHSQSHFMFGRHTRSRPFSETLLRTYSAKKRAEVAPGVGMGTDMFLISGLGKYTPIAPHVLDNLEKIYQTKRRREERAEKIAEEQAEKYVEEITEAATRKDQTVLPDNGNDFANDLQSEAEPGIDNEEGL